jgi:hypothetical protein
MFIHDNDLIGGKMNSSDPFGVLWRRKGLTLALLILTLLCAGCAGIILPWTYKASITETLLDSKKSSAALGGGNPYLSFSSPMVDMANLLALKLTNSANTLALQQDGYTASFQAQILSENAQNQEPFIQISVTGSNQEVVGQTLQGVAASLSTLLAQLQAGVQAQSRLSLQTIAEVSTPVRSSSAKIRPAAAFLGVGLVLTFLIPQAIEGSTARRRKTRAGVTASVGDRPSSRDLGPGAEPDRFRSSYAAETRSETIQEQWPDQQVEDNFRGQHVSPRRQGESMKSRSDFGVPGPDGGRYSETEHRWLCIREARNGT